MVDNRVVITVDTDLKGLTAGASGASGVIRSLEKDVSSLSNASGKLDAGLKAFSWTTFAGGALNVTTALAQVYTSLSNLDRVQLQVKNSMVGVERAEDLLAKKTSMLNAEMSKHGLLSEKSIRLRNEIATATDDLANKEEKLRLAQDQVNDTYILFGTNIVNTLFGTIQTLAGLKAMLAIKSLAVATAIDKETISIAANNAVGAVNIGIQTGMVASRGAMGGMIPALITKQDYLTKSGGALNTVMGAGVLGSGKLASGLNKLMTPAGGASLALVGLGIAMAGAGRSMDEMDGKVDDMYNRFYNVKIITDDFGKSLDAIVDRGDAMTVFGHKLAESLSFGMYKTPNLEKFSKEAATKMLIDLGPVFSQGLTIHSSPEEIKKAYDTKLNDLKTFKATKRAMLVSDTFDESGVAGLMGLKEPVTTKEIELLDSYYDKAIQGSKALFDLAQKSGDAQFSLTDAIEQQVEIMQEENKLSDKFTENIKRSTLEQLKFNEVQSNGNKANENSLITQSKLYDDLKKKLKTEWDYTKPGRNRRSFVKGETGYFTGSEGGPFSGTINQRTNEIFNDQLAMGIFNSVKYLEKWAANQVFTNKKTYQEVQNIIEPIIATYKTQKSISYGGIGGEVLTFMNRFQKEFNNAKNADQEWQKAMSFYQMVSLPKDIYNTPEQNRLFHMTGIRSATPEKALEIMESMTSKSNIFNIQNAENYNSKIIQGVNSTIAAQQALSNKYGITTYDTKGNVSTVPTNANFKTSASKSSNSSSWSGSYGGKSYSSSGLTKSKGRKGGGRNASISAQMESSRKRQLGDAENQYYLGLTGISTGLSTERYSIAAGQHGTRWLWDDFYKRINEANTRIRLGKQILALGEFDPDVSGNIFTNTSSQLTSMLQREQDQINHQSGLIGETREYVIALRNSPQPELLDRMRYSERLEQISTGATVF